MIVPSKFIFYRDFGTCPLAEDVFAYCFNEEQFNTYIDNHRGYQINLVFRSERFEELRNIIMQNIIYGVYILGDFSKLGAGNKEIVVVANNERTLLLHVLCAAIRCTRAEKLLQQKAKNYGCADLLRRAIVEYLKQIKIVLS